MKKYRVRIANDNEIPGYYSGGQYDNYQMFADGGESDIDLSVLLDQATNMIAKAILKDPDPEMLILHHLWKKLENFYYQVD